MRRLKRRLKTGDVVGRFLVLSNRTKRVRRSKRKLGHVCWKMQCKCGAIAYRTISEAERLSGCLICRSSTLKLAPGESGFNMLFNTYKTGAKKRSIPFSLTKKQFKQLVTAPCSYCGLLPDSKCGTTTHGMFLYNGIDRKDNRFSYSVRNSVSCCSWCNRAKWKKTPAEFMAWLGRIRMQGV